MTMKIGCAPCCWGVDDVRNTHLPPWRRVLSEASLAGYSGIEPDLMAISRWRRMSCGPSWMRGA